MRIIYRVPAVRSRQEHAERLARDLQEPGDSIYWDEERRGSRWNKFRIWKDAIESGATHICMIDDDAEVVNRFKEIVGITTEHFPNAIMSYFHGNANPVRAKERLPNTPYLKLRNYDFRGIAITVPVDILPEYIRFDDKWFGKYTYREYSHDDTTLKMFAILNRIDCFLTIPFCVNALQVPSAIHPWAMTKSSDGWAGKDIDVEQFQTSEYGVTKSRRAIDTHLRHDEEIKRIVLREYKRQLDIEALWEK